jgi:hypothetical protein
MERTIKSGARYKEKSWNFVMLTLMQSSLHLEFVEKNFVLTKFQVTSKYVSLQVEPAQIQS